ncbi:FimV/HubP family polar landmark protein [Zestomonas thermotolerans]|uniref:FimV/HubP family polar landmark protein n=1 Tax=Zestomonas thermotolerans TaxID=157784 RepID=UPI0023F40763|nr:FimV/HubP family polar landmark protein [Pseudomonas thermotolerans]
MARGHPFLFTLASGAMLYSGVASALGLGDINLRSALNQPLNAEIQLLEPGDLESHEVVVRLASAEVYQRAGVERFAFLNDLRFAPVLSGGSGVIRVFSSQPVREPYLNFIIEVVRPGGSLVREYTVLLDPPETAAYHAVAARPVDVSPGYVAPAPVAPRRELPPTTQGRQYQVQRGDSLWKIARRLAPESGVSLQRLMDDIHALNPQAFVGGDSHRLIAGATLRLPDAVRLPEPVEAPVAAAPAAAGEASAQPEAQAPVAAAAPSLEELSRTEQRLEAALDQEIAEKLQLQQDLAVLQDQLSRLEEQLRGKDQQIAELERRLAQPQAAEPAVQVPATPSAATGEAEAEASAETAGSGWQPYVWGSLAVLLLGSLLFLRGRRRRPEPVRPEPVVVAPAPKRVSQPEIVQSRQSSEADDLNGIELYLAYGRYTDALDMLRRLAHRQPQNHEVQLRLLDVLGRLDDAAGFARQLGVLASLGVAAELVEPIKARYSGLLAAEAPAEPQPAAAPDASLDVAEPERLSPAEDFQLNLDDLTLNADWDLVSPFETARPAPTEQPVEEFRSNLHVLPEVEELSAGGTIDEPLELNEDFLDAFDALDEEPQAPAREDLSHLESEPSNVVKLNLAMAYIEQGNLEGACNILNEVISEGSPEEQDEARALLARIA